jgi:hypothetical protein
MNVSCDKSKDGADHLRFMGKDHEEELVAPRGILRKGGQWEEDLTLQKAAYANRIEKLKGLRVKTDRALEKIKAEEEAEGSQEEAKRVAHASAVLQAALHQIAYRSVKRCICYCCAQEVPISSFGSHIETCKSDLKAAVQQHHQATAPQASTSQPADGNPEADLEAAGIRFPKVGPPTSSSSDAEISHFNDLALESFMTTFVPCDRCSVRLPLIELEQHRQGRHCGANSTSQAGGGSQQQSRKGSVQRERKNSIDRSSASQPQKH